jgi:hypothetical protein
MDESKHHAAQHETIPKQDQIQAAGDHQGHRDQPSPEAPPQRALRKRKGGGKEADDGAEQGEAAAEKQNVDSSEAHGTGGGGEGAAAAAGADTAAGEKRAIPDAVIEEGRLYMFYRCGMTCICAWSCVLNSLTSAFSSAEKYTSFALCAPQLDVDLLSQRHCGLASIKATWAGPCYHSSTHDGLLYSHACLLCWQCTVPPTP